MATTLQQITDEFYNIVAQTPDDGSGKNTVYTLDFVQNLANVTQREILRSWKFPFMRTKTLFNTAVSTTLSADLETTDTSASVGATTGFESSGAVLIDRDVINYTGTTSSTVTGLTNIDIDHDSGREVVPLRTLPSDFSHDPVLFIGNSFTKKQRLYDYIDEDDYDLADYVFKWTLVTDKDGTEYIRYRTKSTSDIASFQYYKQAPLMSDSVNASIPDEFALQVIPRTMAGVAMIIRDDNPDNLGQIIQEVGKNDIQAMKRYYSTRIGIKSVPFKTKYKSRNPYRYNTNRGYYYNGRL